MILSEVTYYILVVSSILSAIGYFIIGSALIVLAKHKVVGATLGRAPFVLFALFMFVRCIVHATSIFFLPFPGPDYRLFVSIITTALCLTTAFVLLAKMKKLRARNDSGDRFRLHRIIETTYDLQRLKSIIIKLEQLNGSLGEGKEQYGTK